MLMFGFVIGWLILFSLLCFLVLVFHWFGWGLSYPEGRVWVSSFECGFLGVGLVENLFSYTYFLLLVFFVIFDLEVSLLLNIVYQVELYKSFEFYLFFLVLVWVGYWMEVFNGYVGWVQ